MRAECDPKDPAERALPHRTGAVPGEAHLRLREATAALHDALGGHSIPAFISREEYVRYLQMNAPCLFIEPALVAAGIHRLLPDWDARQRGPGLERDLEALQVSWHPRALMIASDDGTLLGWSYVLEGSRFGARLMLRAVEARSNVDLRSATHFLRHGEGVDFWTGFKTALARIDDAPVAIANACNGARMAFGCFLDATPGDSAIASGGLTVQPQKVRR
jgi:heme oxygenase (biliverdin-IX-beta and delta-forming)